MAVTAVAYGQAGGKLSSKSIDWVNDQIGVLLLKSTYTPDQDNHVFVSDLTPGTNEVTGGSYARITNLGGKSVTYNAGTNHTRHFAANAVWSGVTLTARYAVIYDNGPATDATRPVLGYVDFGADVTATAGNFTVTWDATDGVWFMNAI